MAFRKGHLYFRCVDNCCTSCFLLLVFAKIIGVFQVQIKTRKIILQTSGLHCLLDDKTRPTMSSPVWDSSWSITELPTLHNEPWYRQNSRKTQVPRAKRKAEERWRIVNLWWWWIDTDCDSLSSWQSKKNILPDFCSDQLSNLPIVHCCSADDGSSFILSGLQRLMSCLGCSPLCILGPVLTLSTGDTAENV